MSGNLSGIDFKKKNQNFIHGGRTSPCRKNDSKSVNTLFACKSRQHRRIFECANFVIKNVQIATHFTGIKTLGLKRTKIPYYTPKGPKNSIFSSNISNKW